jgi:hypothetical protein
MIDRRRVEDALRRARGRADSNADLRSDDLDPADGSGIQRIPSSTGPAQAEQADEREQLGSHRRKQGDASISGGAGHGGILPPGAARRSPPPDTRRGAMSSTGDCPALR